MTINLECYRYAMPGTRSMKHQRTGTHQQQVRYLAGLEIRTDISQQRLLVMVAGDSRIYRQGGQNVIHFNLCDRLESVKGVMNEYGQLISLENWYPFGGTASWLTGAQAGATLKFQRYAGKERDTSGLIFYGWRYYVPWLMRWLSNDPAGTVDGLNLFRMVGNNPATLCDRDGRMYENPLEDVGKVLNEFEDRGKIGSDLNSIGGQPGVTGGDPSRPSTSQCILLVAVDETPPLIPALPLPGPSTDARKIDCFCQICHKRFDLINLLESHQRNKHRPGILLKCHIAGCEKEFAHKINFYDHLNAHTGTKNNQCSICEALFSRKSDLSRHMNTVHSNKRKYLCEIAGCGMGFVRKDYLRNHINSLHSPETQKLPCPHCDKFPVNKRALIQHINRYHKKNGGAGGQAS